MELKETIALRVDYNDHLLAMQLQKTSGASYKMTATRTILKGDKQQSSVDGLSGGS
ncbi:hypothetical protein T4B_6241 [Trichinella pseudospiralis]|uniref:Uncharacterized protein n=1 Tax=Trichinella pseudospiralis TaxID=6337 RepID=A0A0V1ID20_TRIPS|nr:hypothetical protein T4B_6241 [Trichinella pseudospiralis]